MTTNAAADGSAPNDRALRQRHFALSCDIERSFRYHAHRRGFFDTLHRFTMLVQRSRRKIRAKVGFRLIDCCKNKDLARAPGRRKVLLLSESVH